MPPTDAARAREVGAAPPASLSASAPKSSSATYTWQEVAQHADAKSLWVVVDGRVLDLTSFAQEHPGGSTMLELAAGRDASDLFSMYHIFNEERARRQLARFDIGAAAGPPELPVFAPDAARGGFYAAIKSRLRAHFARTGASPRAPAGAAVRMVPVLAAFAALFWLVHAGGAALPHGGGAWAWALRLAAAAALGVCQALPLLHVMHDASHGAVGGPATWDVVGQGAFDWFAGGSVAAWHHQHVLGHHVYTNVFLADPDLPAVSAGDLRRLVPAQAGHAAYAYQHWYLPLLYGLLALKVRFSDVYDFMYRRMSGPVRVNLPRAVLGRLLLAKAAWLAWRVVMPLALWRMPAAHFAACFLVTDVVTGFWLAYNFQVSHISGDAAWPNGGGEGDAAAPLKAAPAAAPAAAAPEAATPAAAIGDSWAENQVKTSVDYGHDSPAWTFLCGALNYQVEHHLFPGVSQYYYPELAPMVRATCKEFGLPYIYKRNFVDAFSAHWRYLRDMGKLGKQVHMD